MEEKIFSDRKKKAIGLIHKVYLIQLKNAKKHLASTKTKSEVRGGGKKPWRQKGTGNARAGSTRSPLWVGGGVSFGPKPHLVQKKANKKERRLAILSALYLKKNCFQLVENNVFKSLNVLKTKAFKEIFKNMNIENEKRVLIVLPEPNKRLWIASRNLKNVEIVSANCLSLIHILKATKIVLSKQSLEIINNTYGKSYL